MAPAPTGYYGAVMLEALIVGGILAAMMSMAIVVWPINDSPQSAAVMGLVLGALVHIAFEASKANTFYCKNGAACAASRA